LMATRQKICQLSTIKNLNMKIFNKIEFETGRESNVNSRFSRITHWH
jgi:hypothetical protein